MQRWIGSVAAFLMVGGVAIAGESPVDQSLPTYTPAQGVSGSLKSVGSDTMNNLMALWGEQFTKFYPGARVEFEGKGSSTAPPALLENQAQFGPMSREMKGAEIDEFEKKFGYKPTVLRTGIDALALYVHRDNPLDSLTLDQVRRIFSVEGPAQMTWGDLGLTGEWANRPISLYGRNSASGTYGYFKDHALGKSDYKPTVKEQPGSSAVVQGVATDKGAIGYSGLGYKTADVKALMVDEIPAETETALSGEYPLARFLYIYINHKPGSTLDPLRREFIRLIFSQQGQEVVLKDGYIPVPYVVAAEELARLGIGGN